MHFFSVLSLLSLSLGVFADTKEFTLQTLISGNPNIWKGNPLEFAYVFDDSFQLYSSKDFKPTSLVIDDSGRLKLPDNKYVQVKDWGYLYITDQSNASVGFSLKDGYLNYNNYEGFYAIPDGNRYIISAKDPSQGEKDDDSIGIVIEESSHLSHQ